VNKIITFAAICLLTILSANTVFSQKNNCSNSKLETSEERKKANELNNQGTIYYNNKQNDKALEIFKEAVRLYPNNAEGWNNLGVGYAYILKLPAESIEFFQKALCLNPEMVTSYYSLGTVYLNLGDYSNAIRYLQETLWREPNKINAINNLAVAYMKKKDYEKSLELIRLALKRKPNDYILLNNLASIEFYLKKFGDAQISFLKAIKINPKEATAQYNLGIVFLKLKNKDAAIEQYNILKQIDVYWANLLYQGIYKDKILFLSEPQSY
jgi:tetratricopeptide (TPR) repeat protein